MSITIKHSFGFFSCCSVKLSELVNYINLNKKTPINVDSSEQFSWYKNMEDKDITYNYFENYNNITNVIINTSINYHHTHQFNNYSDVDYGNLNGIICKYFSPSDNIIERIRNIENKYNLIYENVCVLFYRGNDKATETKLCDYDEYLTYANEVLQKRPNIVFLIQSDETEFIEFMSNTFPDNSFYFNDEIRHLHKCLDTVDKKMRKTNSEFSKQYLAITIIMSKCKYIICGSGNCSIWIMLYRNSNKNVAQYLNGTWYNNIEEIN